ncbi:MAG: hypothetical protein Kow0068_13890 [Marinilabiliales bacterium]
MSMLFGANKQVIPFWNGILVGCTTEEQVIKLIGEGYVSIKDGTKGRSYVNRNHNLTICIRFDAKDTVTTIEFVNGNMFKDKDEEFLKKISLQNIGDSISIGRNITFHFKMKPRELISQLGEPDDIHIYPESVQAGYRYFDDFYLEVISGAEFLYFNNILKKVTIINRIVYRDY